MRPLTLRLRGFKGILSGSGRDELFLDFSGLSGLVALVGPNGSGKTTVLDNLHPYRIMPYRAGSYSPRSFSFYNETVGADALKELEFELDGRRYRSLVLIDAERRKQEAYLYEWTVDRWTPLCDGGTDAYDRTVETLVGSPQLFFTGVFRCQDALRLSDYTKGEMKAVFVELLSIEALKGVGLRARARKDAILKEKEWLVREKERLAGVVNEAGKAKSEVAEVETRIKSLEKEAVLLKERVEDKRDGLRRLEAQVALYEQALRERNDLEKTLNEKVEKRKKAEIVLSRAEMVRKAATDEKRLACKIEILKKELMRLDDRIGEFDREEKTLRESERKLMEAQKELSEIRLARKHRSESLKKDLHRAKEAVKLLGEAPCGPDLHGRCAFLKNAVNDRAAMPGIVGRLKSCERPSEEETALEVKIKNLEALLLPLGETAKEREKVARERSETMRRLHSLESEFATARKDAVLLPEVEFFEGILPGLIEEIKEIEEKLRSFKEETSPAEALKAAKDEIRGLERDRERQEEKLRQAASSLAVFQKTVADGEAAAGEIASLDKRMEVMDRDISEWMVLEKAFGDDGIVALEIDDAGPAISAIANDLLLSCFGPRFTVRIDTQAARAGGKGLKETFDIVVFDTERDESKSLKVMSGGEKVWIEEAVTRAICLYNAARSGRKFQALFTDEKDGALDFRRKKEFMAMKRKALEIGGFDMEFFISQSPEIQDLADSTIDLEEV